MHYHYLRHIEKIFNSDFFSARYLHEGNTSWCVFIFRNPKCYHFICWRPCKLPVKHKSKKCLDLCLKVLSLTMTYMWGHILLNIYLTPWIFKLFFSNRPKDCKKGKIKTHNDIHIHHLISLLFFYRSYVKVINCQCIHNAWSRSGFSWYCKKLSSKFVTPYSDWHLNSPHSLTLESNVKVMGKKGNDHQIKNLLIVTQILLINTIQNVERTVRRIWLLL